MGHYGDLEKGRLPWRAKERRRCSLRKVKSPFIKGGGVMLVVDSRVKKPKPKCESQSCFFLKGIIFLLEV